MSDDEKGLSNENNEIGRKDAEEISVGIAPYHGGKPRQTRKGRKLVESDVIEIRKSPQPRRMLAEQFGVSVFMIAQIQTGKSWKHVDPPRATIRRRQRRAACRQCGETFAQAEDGAPRRYCDDCRVIRARAMAARRSSEITEQRLRPLIERVVREILIEAGLLGYEKRGKPSRRAKLVIVPGGA